MFICTAVTSYYRDLRNVRREFWFKMINLQAFLHDKFIFFAYLLFLDAPDVL